MLYYYYNVETYKWIYLFCVSYRCRNLISPKIYTIYLSPGKPKTIPIEKSKILYKFNCFT